MQTQTRSQETQNQFSFLRFRRKKSSSRRKSLRKRFPKGSIVTDSKSEETQPDINIQPAKTNNDTENKRDELSSGNVNSDMKIRTIDPYFSFTEETQETDTQNNSNSESEDESVSGTQSQ